jgi:hypothetical protein
MQDFLDEAFDTPNEEGIPAFPLLPRDRYKAEIVSAKAGPTKNSKGYAINLTWSIIEGEYDARVVFQSVLIQHESAEAMKIGRGKFKDILNAIGVTEAVTDLKVLLHKPALIGVIVREDKNGQYADRNDVNRVMPLTDSNGARAREAIKEAQKVQPAFIAVNGKMDDDIPF